MLLCTEKAVKIKYNPDLATAKRLLSRHKVSLSKDLEDALKIQQPSSDVVSENSSPTSRFVRFKSDIMHSHKHVNYTKTSTSKWKQSSQTQHCSSGNSKDNVDEMAELESCESQNRDLEYNL